MGMQEETIGGEPTSEFAQEFMRQLGASLFATGGESPENKTTGIFRSISDIIGGQDIAGTGQSIAELVERGTERQAGRIRESFGGGLLFGGSPAFSAESQFRAEAAPTEATALFGLEQQRLAQLMPLLGMGGQFAAMGTPQAQAFLTPDAFSRGFQGFLDVANVGSQFVNPFNLGGGGGVTT